MISSPLWEIVPPIADSDEPSASLVPSAAVQATVTVAPGYSPRLSQRMPEGGAGDVVWLPEGGEVGLGEAGGCGEGGPWVGVSVPEGVGEPGGGGGVS